MGEILPRFGMIMFPLSAVTDTPEAIAQGKWLVLSGVLATSAVGLFASIRGYLGHATREPKPAPEIQIIQHEMYCPACRRMHFVSDYNVMRR